ncbi:hypothetical protein C5167_038373 [Papaver somniferum]|uniref:3-hydroxyisobutyryl-CoA hydrolase n=1 Tax=Papaver somniferum TaxID=3469 RepID=A0A4Y7ICQ6_PAPSO|nr:hypothetical protein C5167_038373 [Papaver somniferum]
MESSPSSCSLNIVVVLFTEKKQIVVVPMAQERYCFLSVVLREDANTHVRLITLNRPRQLNVISPKVVSLLAESLEQWEKDDNVELVLFKGNGRAYSAGGDLKVFYDGRDSCKKSEFVASI